VTATAVVADMGRPARYAQVKTSQDTETLSAASDHSILPGRDKT
jgi:hypothetical protein